MQVRLNLLRSVIPCLREGRLREACPHERRGTEIQGDTTFLSRIAVAGSQRRRVLLAPGRASFLFCEGGKIARDHGLG